MDNEGVQWIVREVERKEAGESVMCVAVEVGRAWRCAGIAVNK